MRIAGHGVAAGADEEVQIHSPVGLHDVVDVQLLPAPQRRAIGGPRGFRGLAALQLLGGDIQVDPPAGDVQADHVAVPDE